MKIVQLHVENVKRVKVATIVPDGPIIAVGGKNGAGKSSLLDSVAYVLGGMALVPEVPIRRGEREAKIDVDLGDLKVTRTFKKKVVKTKDTSGNEVEVEAPLESTLVVRNADGIKQGTPQEILDKIISKHTFDPLVFFNANDKEKRATLLKLANVDTTLIDAQRAEAFTRRTDANRKLGQAEARLNAAKKFDDVPAQEIPASEVFAELEAAHAAQKKVDDRRSAHALCVANIKVNAQKIAAYEEEISRLEEKLARARSSVRVEEEQRAAFADELLMHEQAIADLTATLPDLDAIKKRAEEVEAINVKVRENVKWTETKAAHDKLVEEVADLTGRIQAFDANKVEILRNAKLPITGLEITEDGVTFNGLPLSQASTAEALQVSVSIGLALNPQLKVLFIKHGNDLDNDSRAIIARMAEENDAQVWMEVVTRNETDKEGVSVLIQDGEIV